MGAPQKTSATLGGTPLAAADTIIWRIIAGTRPYTTIMTVHNSDWDPKLKNMMKRRSALKLVITDGQGTQSIIRDLTILQPAPNSSRHRTSFVVADRRWRWAYKGIVRDYNIPRKTGDLKSYGNRRSLPETAFTADQYDYLRYSLKDVATRWSAEDAVRDVLEQLETKDKFNIDSFPIKKGVDGEGQFTLQNIRLEDTGDNALARVLAFIPGAQVYVGWDGVAHVYDAADLPRAESYLKSLPPLTKDGEKPELVDRQAIRPSQINVHYQREVEAVFEYADNYSTTLAQPGPKEPFIENVIPTVDQFTTVREFDPELGATAIRKDLPPGTWVEFRAWLVAMNEDDVRPDNSLPWTFETIRRHWLHGDLDGVLGGRGLDFDDDANVSMRIQAIKEHFRQSFRINRRFTERLIDIRPIRAGLLHPTTGARARSAVWGEACVVPTNKGKFIASRTDPANAKAYRNVTFLPKLGEKLIDTPPGPTLVNFLDRELGIFRLDWILSPYGTVESFIPCMLADTGGKNIVVSRNFATQDKHPMAPGIKMEGGTNGIFLATTMKYKIMVTIIPAAPNNKNRYHVVQVKAKDIKGLFRSEFRIQDGKGPPLDVFVPPGETTARFAWQDDTLARLTIGRLLGLNSNDPKTAGLVDDPDTPADESQMLGFVLINKDRDLRNHSTSLAAEILAPFADNFQGNVATIVPTQGLVLRGNMTSATIQVAAADSAKVNAVHQFPGQQKPISRFALFTESVRRVIQGIIPWGRGDS